MDNVLNFFTNSNITPVQMIGYIEILIGLFGLYVAYSFRRSCMFRFKLAMVYCMPIIAGLMTIFDFSDTHFVKHLLVLAFMIFITVLYWREVKALTTTEGYHKKALADYLDDVPDLIWVKDADCRYSYCNKAMLKVFQVKREEILGKTDIELGICKRRKNQRFDFDLICDKSDRIVKVSQEEKKFLESGYIDNNFYSFQVYKAPILIQAHDAKKKHIGYIGIARDLTYDVLDHKEIQKLIDEGSIEEALSLFCIHKERYDVVKLTDEELIQIRELTRKYSEKNFSG